MKYTEYTQVRELFESDMAQSYGYDLNEWDSLQPEEKGEQLNEILGLAWLTGALLAKIGIGAGVGLLGLGIAFRKRIIAAGVKKIYLRKLTKLSRDFKEQAMEGLKKAITPLIEAKARIKEEAGVETWKDLPSDKRREIANIELKIATALSEYINKVSNLKREQIYKMIENNKRLKDTAKLALKFSWETLSSEVKVGLLAELMKDKIIESPGVIEKIDVTIEEETANLKNRQGKVIKKIKDVNNGMKGAKDGEKGGYKAGDEVTFDEPKKEGGKGEVKGEKL